MKKSNTPTGNFAVHHPRFGEMQRQRRTMLTDEDGKMFDESKVETLKGTVLFANHSHSRKGGRSYTVQFMLRTETDSIPVHLGPAWYVDKQNVKICSKDRVEVTGSMINLNGKQTIIAAEIEKGGKVLKLRDKGGVPAWARGMRRR